jgi:hypothetical protein
MTPYRPRASGRRSIVTFLSLTVLFSAIVYALAAFIEEFRGAASAARRVAIKLAGRTSIED